MNRHILSRYLVKTLILLSILLTIPQTTAFSSRSYTLSLPTSYELRHNAAPSTPWTTFAGPGVNSLFGNFVWQELDLTVPGRGLDFAFLRTYNSVAPTAGSMGLGWTHSYDLSLAIEAADSITIKMADGRLDHYTLSGGQWLAPTGIFNTLTDNGDGTFSLALKDQTRYDFNNIGQLTDIVDRNSNTITLIYSGNNLISITDTVGRNFSLAYDANNKLISVTDPLSRTVAFTYDANGDLATATNPKGKVTTYGYDANRRLISLTDANNHAQFTLTYNAQDQVIESRDAENQLTSFSYNFTNGQTTVTDARTNPTLYTFDDTYRFIGVQDPLGYSTSNTYDAANNLVTFTDKRNFSTQYQYDARGNVTQVSDPLNGVVQLTYDPQNNPLTITNQRNHTTNLAYDAGGNLLTITDALNGVTTFSYDGFGQVTSITDAEGRVTPVSYDADGNVQQITDALNKATNLNYDLVGRITGVTDRRNESTQLNYDDTDNPTEITDPLGHTTHFTYDAVGNRLSVTDANNHVTSYQYNPRNLLTQVTDAAGGQTQYSYDANGNLTQATDPNGNTVVTVYDALNRPISITDELGNSESYQYDPNSNRTQVTDAAGGVTSTVYDALNRPTQVTDPLGRVTTFAYDAAGNRTSSTDPLSHTTGYGYDELNRLTSVTDAGGNTVRYEYDDVGNRTAIVNARGNRTNYSYDPLNRLQSESDPLGHTVFQTYDANGNRVSMTDANGNTTSWVFDALNRIERINYPAAGDTPANSVAFTYDAVGNRIRLNDITGITSYSYDALNRLTALTNPRNQTVSYQYDAAGNRTRITYPDNSQINYSYDAANRLKTVTDALGPTRYEYNERGQRTTTFFANGVSSRTFYDAAGQVNDIITTSPISGTLLSIGYVYDAAGNRTQMVDNEGITNYSYDNLNRLTEAVYPDDTFQRFTYDAAGNRKTLVDASGTTSYSYDQADRLTQMTPPGGGSMTFTWDNNGNMLSRSDGTSYTWDAANRLTKVVNGNGTVQFAYDGDGRRTSKMVDGVTSTYLWDTVADLPVILNESIGDVSTKYTYGGDLLAMVESASDPAYYHVDALGSARSLSNSDAAGTASYRYDAFGNTRGTTGALRNPFQFAGQQKDDKTDLYYLRARYYDPFLGRFLSRDPLDFSIKMRLVEKENVSDRVHPYNYARNSPVVYLDNNGEAFFAVAFGIIAVGTIAYEFLAKPDIANAPTYDQEYLYDYPSGRPVAHAALQAGLEFGMPTIISRGPGRSPNFPNPAWFTGKIALREGANELSEEIVGNLIDKTIDPHQLLDQMLFPLAEIPNPYYRQEISQPEDPVRNKNRTDGSFSTYSEKVGLPISAAQSDFQYKPIPNSPVALVGRSPNRPTPTQSPGAYDWYVTYNGSAPEICIQDNGDPDGDSIIGYQFEITGAQNHTSSILGSRCYTPPNLGYFTFAWRGRVVDASGLVSDWSDTWHYSVANPEVTLDPITFEVDPSDSQFIFINACAQGGGGLSITLRVSANRASDGSANGDWQIIKEQGSPCFTTIDRPRWDTRTFANGPHLVRVEAFKDDQTGRPIVDVEEAVYTLPDRPPFAPPLIAPSTDQNRNVYLSDRTVTFRWAESDRADYYQIYFSLTHPAVGDDPTPLLSETLPAGQTSYTYTFDQFYPTVYWGVRAYNNLGYGGSDVGYSIMLDNQPPTAAVQSLPGTSPSSSFVVNWSGSDNNAGIAYYDIQVRDDATGIWQAWQYNTTATAAIYAGQDGHTYCFRARAADRAGLLGSFAGGDGDTCTHVDLAASGPWWDYDYLQRRDVTLLHNGTATLPIGYPLRLRLDGTTSPTAAEMCGASLSATPGDDFRIVYNGTNELDRQIKTFSCTEIDIWFAAQTSLAAGGSDTTNYKLYYGNAAATAPPAALLNIFLPVDDGSTLALYPFEETGGSTVTDLSGHGNNGTIASGVTRALGVKLGSALSFPGGNGGGVSIPAASSLSTSAFTFEAFARRSFIGPGCTGPIASQGLAGDGRERWLFSLQGDDGKVQVYSGGGSSEVFTNAGITNGPLPDTNWHHIAFTFDGGSTVKFYRDGNLLTTKTLSQSGIRSSQLNLHIGENFDGTQRFCGQLDGVRFSNGLRTTFPHAGLARVTPEPSLVIGNEQDAPPPPPPTPTPTPTPPPQNIYTEKRAITVKNNMSGKMLPSGYPVHLHFDNTTSPSASEIYNASQSSPKCNDLRIFHNDAMDLDRVLQSCSSSAIDIWFRTQDSIPTGGTNNTSYQLYYANPIPDSPPGSPSTVFDPPKDANTVTLWYMDEGSGSTLGDDSGGNHNCTIDSTTTWVTPDKFSGALHFPGGTSGPTVNCGTSSAYNLQTFTFEMFLKRTGAAWGRIAGHLGNYQNRWLMNFEGDGKFTISIWPCAGCGSEWFRSNTAIGDMVNWHHIAFTLQSQTLKIYIDGQLDSTHHVQNGNIVSGTPSLTIGSSENIERVRAEISHVRLSNIARTSFPYGGVAAITTEPTLTVGAARPVEEAPIAVDDTAITDEDTAAAVAMLNNDHDPNGDPLSVTNLTQPANGIVVLQPDNTAIYTPTLNFYGTDYFSYTANDGLADSNVATVTLTVNPVDDLPIANNDSVATGEDTPVTIAILVNDVNVDADPLAVTNLTQPNSGVVSLNPNNTVTYTPTLNFNGVDFFNYTVNDGITDSNVATVTVTVNSINDVPVANDDATTLDGNATAIISVLTNDTDADQDHLTVTGLTQPVTGGVSLNLDNTVTYTPTLNFSGSDTFTYMANDGLANSNVATVTVTAGWLTVVPQIITTTVGQTFSVGLMVETGRQQLDNVSAHLNFDETKLQILNITPGDTLDQIQQNQFDNSQGSIDFTAGTLSNFPTGNFRLATITLLSLAETPSTTLTFNTNAPRQSERSFGGASMYTFTKDGTISVLNTTLVGSVSLQGRPAAPDPRWQVPLVIDLNEPGQTIPTYHFNPITDDEGYFIIAGIAPGTYDISVKNSHTLRVIKTVTISPGINNLVFGILREGDADNNNAITLLDFNILAVAFGQCVGDVRYDERADFDHNDCVTLLDFNQLATNFGQIGD